VAAYTGAWRRGQQYTAAGPNPNLGTGIRAEHLTPTEPGDPFHEPTPILPPAPEYLYVQDEYMIPTGQLVTDPVIMEPLGHEYGTVPEGGQSQAEATAEAYTAHMADYGAAAVHHRSPPIGRADRDTYNTQRVEQEFPTTGSRAALTRGRNAWPENNPDGPPDQGHSVGRWIDRQFTRRGIRPDMMPLRPYVAGIGVNTPAPAPGQANQYTSPYANLVSARLLKLTTPQVRRVPRPPDDAALTDGTEDPQYTVPQYWQDW
jgi:hypothetical protein